MPSESFDFPCFVSAALPEAGIRVPQARRTRERGALWKIQTNILDDDLMLGSALPRDLTRVRRGPQLPLSERESRPPPATPTAIHSIEVEQTFQGARYEVTFPDLGQEAWASV